MQRLSKASRKTVGAKQTLKAIERGLAQVVFVASDADDKVRRPIIESCQNRGVALVEAGTMMELGKACGVQVGTAAAAILE